VIPSYFLLGKRHESDGPLDAMHGLGQKG
jgi:hypothetical protein